MRAALVQITSSDDPAETLPRTRAAIDAAVSEGAGFVLTPEVTNCVSSSRSLQREVLSFEDDDPTLAALRDAAARHGIWLLIGSLGLKLADESRFANRSFMIGPAGEIAARYDKIHMFDVDISETETYRESDGYRPGDSATVVETGFAKVGMAVCYDLRFPYLFRALAHAGAEILTLPAAFTTVSGAAHWHTLLRARAIETGCWVLAPGQTGTHSVRRGPPRASYGHSLAVAPWGEIVLDMGTAPGVGVIDLDMAQVAEARRRIPAIRHDRPFKNPSPAQ
ncbi:MAG: carbon-nitrogen hydrolase family protein [Pseudomonadota bacterium]